VPYFTNVWNFDKYFYFTHFLFILILSIIALLIWLIYSHRCNLSKYICIQLIYHNKNKGIRFVLMIKMDKWILFKLFSEDELCIAQWDNDTLDRKKGAPSPVRKHHRSCTCTWCSFYFFVLIILITPFGLKCKQFFIF
jgi:hypothetical protein